MLQFCLLCLSVVLSTSLHLNIKTTRSTVSPVFQELEADSVLRSPAAWKQEHLENWTTNIGSSQKGVWVSHPKSKWPASMAAQGNPVIRVLHHHIWKDGGTFFCDLAHADNLVAPRNEGCHRFKDDATLPSFENYQGPALWKPCAVAGANSGLASLPFNFIEHECPGGPTFLQEVKAQGFTLSLIIREPLQQTLSWYRHLFGDPPGRQKYPNAPREGLLEWIQSSKVSASFFDFRDNLQTRWLSGCNGDLAVDTTCFEKAKAAILKYDVVLDLTEINLDPKGKLTRLGMQKPAEPVSDTSDLNILNDQQKNLIRRVQLWDLQLYNWALREGIISAQPPSSTSPAGAATGP